MDTTPAPHTVVDVGGVTAAGPLGRRTQAERTERTRGALLDATVVVLAERGYSGMSTTEVAKRAGVSRGAQLHHFPSKLALVEGAVHHVFAQREAAFRERFHELLPEERTEAAAVSLFWEVTRSASHDALHELALAARTDDALRPLVGQAVLESERAIVEVFCELLPEAAHDPFVAIRVRVAMALMQSANLHHQLGLEDQALELVAALSVLTETVPLNSLPALPPEPHLEGGPS
jgi:AcrR family transcriptional regulator